MHPLLNAALRRRTSWLLACALALVAVAAGLPSPASAAPTAAPWVSGNPTFTRPSARPAELGVVYQGTWNIMTATQRGKVLDNLKAAGVGWVTLDLGWKSLQPTSRSSYSMGDVAEWDRQVTEVRSRGIKVMAIFHTAPSWASGTSAKNGRPKDPTAYASAAAWVAKRYNGSTVSSTLRIDAMQIWNEPNLKDFWAPDPSTTRVSSFANLVKAAGPAIKRANPNMKVVVGGLTTVDTDWYSQFVKTSGVVGTYDALGVHPYQSPGDASPETYDASWGKYYMRHLSVLDKLMTSKNDKARIWATEYGWSTHSNTSSTPGWARGVSESTQADYLLRSMKVMAATPRVQAAFWYAAVTTSSGDTQFDNYALLRKDYSRKPAYYALKCAASGVCGPTSGTATPTTSTTRTLVSAGSTWSYSDTGKNLGTTWRTPSYDQTGWAKGAARLGYGGDGERTRLRSGSWSTHPTTTYFRRTFDAGSSTSAITSLRLRALIDDGAVVYLNGKEVWRTNLPSGTVYSGTRASTAVAGTAEQTWKSATISKSALRTGKNFLAVEVHQSSPTSSDLSFDLALTAS
jgi:polysaccharide biosynthesis protein PslG